MALQSFIFMTRLNASKDAIYIFYIHYDDSFLISGKKHW